MILVRRLTRDGLHRRIGGIIRDVRLSRAEVCRQVGLLRGRLSEARVLVRQNSQEIENSAEYFEKIEAAERELDEVFK